MAVANIQHTDMVFADGTPPSDLVLKKFLRLCEQYIYDCPEVESTNVMINEPNVITANENVNDDASSTINVGAVAVHCKGKISSLL